LGTRKDKKISAEARARERDSDIEVATERPAIFL
jgi:hypothetical protein